MQEVSTKAIRFDPLSKDLVGESLAGLRPIVVFADQGGMKIATGPEEEQQEESALKHGFDRIIVCVDHSSSMSESILPDDGRSKLSFLQQNFTDNADSVLMADVPLSLVTFDNEANISLNSYGTKTLEKGELLKKFKELSPAGGTNFSNPLELVKQIVEEDTREAGHPIRTLFVFGTDGEDQIDSKLVDPLKLSRQLQELNVTSYLLGIGAGYSSERIFELASALGFCGWAHIPESDGTSMAIRELIPEFIRDVCSSDKYLNLRATGDFEHFTSFTHTQKRAYNNQVVNMGYTQHGAAILLEKKDNVELRLDVGDFAADPDRAFETIEIIDANVAPGLAYEYINRGQEIIDAFLSFYAQANRDVEMIRALNEHFGDGRFDELLKEYEEDPSLRYRRTGSQHSYETMSQTGTIRHPSQYRPIQQPNRDADYPQNPTLEVNFHSGALGRLDQSFSGDSIPLPSQINPQNYAKLIQLEGAELTLVSGISTDNINHDAKHTELLLGRSSDAELHSSDPSVSRKHLKMSKLGDEYVIEDLNSRNGTYVGDTLIKPGTRFVLNTGDVISGAGPQNDPTFKIIFKKTKSL